MPVNGLQRRFIGTERHVRDGTQHDDARYHGQRLQPQKRKSAQHPQVHARGQRAAPEGNGALQPAGTRQPHKYARQGPLALLAGFDDHLTVPLDARVHRKFAFLSRLFLSHDAFLSSLMISEIPLVSALSFAKTPSKYAQGSGSIEDAYISFVMPQNRLTNENAHHSPSFRFIHNAGKRHIFSSLIAIPSVPDHQDRPEAPRTDPVLPRTHPCFRCITTATPPQMPLCFRWIRPGAYRPRTTK